MSVEIEIVYNGNLNCTARHGPSGATITTDAPADNGGRGESFSPTDLVATALGTCIMTIMGLVAARDGLDLTGTVIRVTKEMVSEPARRIGSLTLGIAFPNGLKISDGERTKLEKVIRSCPVYRSLNSDVDVKTEFVYPD